MNKKITVSLTSKQVKELTKIMEKDLDECGRKISMEYLIRKAVDDYIIMQKKLNRMAKLSAADRAAEM
ncbi:MAG: hypothetical protein HZA77_03170 [Candidatus Schekmanbacteria bacterium]|nr:hypothetical protein [Candidatus Schekmanbacteria bacterium]